MVPARSIAKLVSEVGQHFLDDPGIDRRSRMIIKVDWQLCAITTFGFSGLRLKVRNRTLVGRNWHCSPPNRFASLDWRLRHLQWYGSPGHFVHQPGVAAFISGLTT